MLRSALRYTTFPLMLGGATGVAFALLRAGVDESVVVGGVGLACVLLVATLERVVPYVAAYNHSRGDVSTDALHNLVSGIAIPELVRVFVLSLMFAWGQQLSQRVGFALWPSAWPVAAQLVLALLVAELGGYWLHRLQHASLFWWRMHATHHSVPRLYWLNAARFHPFDAVLSYASLMVPLVILGTPPLVLALLTVFLTVHGLLQHSNIDLRHGPLNWVFSSAELHRWHHAPEPADGNHNFGTVLALYDVLFKTRFLPSDRRPPVRIGIAGMSSFPTDYVGQLASPFTWKRLTDTQPEAGHR